MFFSLIYVRLFLSSYDYILDLEPFIIPVPWVTLIAGVIPAQMVRAVFGGPLADRFGRKLPIYFCLVGNLAFTFLEMFGTSVGMIFAGSFLNGICYVLYFGLAPTYASEVVPYHLRNISIAFKIWLSS